MAGKYRKVKQGEWLAKIAHEEKYTDDGKIIWDDSNNANVRATYPNPNLLCDHAKLYIPEKKKKDETGPVDNAHKFVVRNPTTLLRIMVIDMDGNPVEDEPYRLLINLTVFGGKTYTGAPMSDKIGAWEPGIIMREIPISSEKGILELPHLNVFFDINIGHLRAIDPDDKKSGCANKGVQARLNNLGFGCGAIDGIVGSKTSAAVHAFQTHMKENKATIGYDSGTADGIPGPITRGALKRYHGEL